MFGRREPLCGPERLTVVMSSRLLEVGVDRLLPNGAGRRPEGVSARRI
jgi:hypothetical protein